MENKNHIRSGSKRGEAGAQGGLFMHHKMELKAYDGGMFLTLRVWYVLCVRGS